MRHATIDRFEGDKAVLALEPGEKVVPRLMLPAGAQEGDVIDLDTGLIDRDETERRREEVRAARERAFAGKKPPSEGDFEL